MLNRKIVYGKIFVRKATSVEKERTYEETLLRNIYICTYTLQGSSSEAKTVSRANASCGKQEL